MTRQEFLELPDAEKWEIVSKNLNDIAKIKERLTKVELVFEQSKPKNTGSMPPFLNDIFKGTK
jgi:hypothetical protein